MKRGGLLGILCMTATLSALKLDRVVLACDSNPLYIQFWPIVARAWSQLIGVRPTLALIAGPEIHVDETLGDVIRFDPIPGVPNSLYAQAVRLLLPALFKDEVSIISDIDMIPLSKSYFCNSIKHIRDDQFVVYKNKAYPDDYGQFPMCYNAAKGSTFRDIFGVKTIHDIPRLITEWHALNWGWNTDEKVLHTKLCAWPWYRTRCVKLGHTVARRIDRLAWGYEKGLLKTGFYVDAHCVRPYLLYKKQIDKLLKDRGLRL